MFYLTCIIILLDHIGGGKNKGAPFVWAPYLGVTMIGLLS